LVGLHGSLSAARSGSFRSSSLSGKSPGKASSTSWSEYDPAALENELADLAYQAEDGDAYCSSMTCTLVPEPRKNPTWDGTDFFNLWDDEEEHEVQATGLIVLVKKRKNEIH